MSKDNEDPDILAVIKEAEKDTPVEEEEEIVLEEKGLELVGGSEDHIEEVADSEGKVSKVRVGI